MGGVISTLFGGGAKPQGPSRAELQMQKDARDKALTDRAEAERLAALSQQATSRRKSLAYTDPNAGQVLAG